MSRISRDRALMDRLGDVMSQKTGIPREEINVRNPSRNTDTRMAEAGQRCDLCGREFKSGAYIRHLIVQEIHKPVSSMRRMVLCTRMTACIKRFKERTP